MIRIKPSVSLRREHIIARAEKGEMRRREPVEEGDVLSELLGGHGRGIPFEALDCLGEMRQHRLPIAYHRAHVAEDPQKPRAQPVCKRLVDLAIEGEHHDAFLDGRSFRDSRTGLVSGRRNDRVKGGRNARPLGPDFGDAGIIEEWNVVIHRNNDGLVAGKCRVLGSGVENLDQGCARDPPRGPREDELHQRRQFGTGVVDQVLRRCVASKAGEERREFGIAGPDHQTCLFGRGALRSLDHAGRPSHVSPLCAVLR